MPDQNDHFHPKMVPGHGQQQPHHMNTNHNRSPSAAQIGGVIQSTATLKDRSGHNLLGNVGGGNNGGSGGASCSFLGNSGNNNMQTVGTGSAGGNGYYNMMSSNSSGSSSNSGTCVGGSNSINRPHIGPVSGTTPSSAMGVAGEFAALIPGGLHIKDAKQINSEAGKNGRDSISSGTEPSDLVKDILMHAMQSSAVSVSPKRNSPLRTPVPSNQSPTRSRSPPASMLLQSIDQTSAACVNKSFEMISANVPSTTDSTHTTGTKASIPATASRVPGTVVPQAIVSDRTSPNQNITSNDDSADSNSSKSRRRRKPDRTNKMGSEELERMHDFLGGGDNSADKCDRIDGIDPMRPNIAVRNDIATLALEGISSLSQGLASDSSHSPHITDLSDSTRINLQNLNDTNSNATVEDKIPGVSSVISGVLSVAAAVMKSTRNDSESNSDDCETIDKIAAMISSTESETIPAQISLQLPEEATSLTTDNNDSGTCNGPTKDVPPTEGSLVSSADKPVFPKNDADKSYEEIENKLEEMFAGIEETLPPCSKSPPLEAKNATLAKQAVEPTDILTELSEKTDEVASACEVPAGKAGDDSPEPSTSGTQKKNLTPAAKRANVGKQGAAPGTPPNKRKKVLKKKAVQAKGASFAAAEERASTFGAKVGKKPVPKGNGKKGNGSGAGANKNIKVKPSEYGGSAVDPNAKYKGPYVQVKSDGSHLVINAPINEDDSDKQQNKTKKFSNSMNNSEKSKIRGLHVSTLSTKYDADTTDISWMCVFCKMGPHKLRLGDLFGPYIISTKSSEFKQSQTDEDFFNVKRTRESLVSRFAAKIEPPVTENAPKSKKRKTGEPTPSAPVPSTSGTQLKKVVSELEPVDMFYGMVKAGDDSYEVWMHEDCLVWAPGVYIIGTRIVGLEAAIWNCCRHQCRICTHYGAMVSCLQRGCSEEAHVVCARKNNWELDKEFKSHCQQHSKANS